MVNLVIVQECPFMVKYNRLMLQIFLIVVVRYFGGVKLGVGGLINAYRTTAQMALEQSKIVEQNY